MKITVCSFENRTDTELYRMVHRNHVEYCKAHGYEYYEVNDFSRWPERDHAVWHKFQLIDEAWHDSDFVFYIDFDAVFTNFSIGIEQFADAEHILLSKDCLGGRDVFDYGWNIGVILLPNVFKAKELVWLMNSDFIYGIFNVLQHKRLITFREQSAFEALFENVPYFKGIVKEVPR